MKDKWTRFEYRKERTRKRLTEEASGRPRLTVYRSLKHLYAQVVDDQAGKTLAAASTLSAEMGDAPKTCKNIEFAKKVGGLIAKKALAAGVKKVAFDRGAYRYHGRVKALADAARAGGLEF